jgi:hypothetical protein
VLKQRRQDEKLKGIVKGVILAERTELERARSSRPGRHKHEAGALNLSFTLQQTARHLDGCCVNRNSMR